MLCKYCGWGHRAPCETSGAAMLCRDNLENVRKFCLRFKDDPAPPPEIVYSRRGQGKDGKGDSWEFLTRVE